MLKKKIRHEIVRKWRLYPLISCAKLPTMSLLYKPYVYGINDLKIYSGIAVLGVVIGGGILHKICSVFSGEDIFIALRIDWKNSFSQQISCNMWSLICENTSVFPALKIQLFLSSENSTVSLGEIYTSLQEVVLALVSIRQ